MTKIVETQPEFMGRMELMREVHELRKALRVAYEDLKSDPPRVEDALVSISWGLLNDPGE